MARYSAGVSGRTLGWRAGFGLATDCGDPPGTMCAGGALYGRSAALTYVRCATGDFGWAELDPGAEAGVELEPGAAAVDVGFGAARAGLGLLVAVALGVPGSLTGGSTLLE